PRVGLVVARRAGREPAPGLTKADNPVPLVQTSKEVFLVSMQSMHEIATDLITPLGAYLRLREGGRASFLLESVERGRLGRHSFAGFGSRLLAFDEAERCGEPVVGYLGYDFVAELEPTVSLPDAGPAFPGSRFVVPDVLIRFDHALGLADVLRGDPEAIAKLLADERTRDSPQTGTVPSRSTRRVTTKDDYVTAVRNAQEYIKGG